MNHRIVHISTVLCLAVGLAVPAVAAEMSPMRTAPAAKQQPRVSPQQVTPRVSGSQMALLSAQRWLKSVGYDRTLEQMQTMKSLRLQMYGTINGVSTQTLISNENLVHLKALPNLEELALPRWTNDSGLANVAGLTKLTVLNIPQAPITDVGMGYLKNLVYIRSLVLGSKSITDAGLVNLANMRLEILNLDGSSITDAGMVQIGKLSGLGSLFLNYTAITDASIPEIVKLRYLRRLDITGTKITPQGRDRIRAAIPGIQIY